MSGMMCFLILDVLQCFINNRLAHRECTIASLPFKSLILRIDGFDPSAAVSFHFLDNVGYGHVLG